MTPHVIQVIESDELRGNGSPENPYRRIRVYHTLDGVFLAEEKDPYLEPKP